MFFLPSSRKFRYTSNKMTTKYTAKILLLFDIAKYF